MSVWRSQVDYTKFAWAMVGLVFAPIAGATTALSGYGLFLVLRDGPVDVDAAFASILLYGSMGLSAGAIYGIAPALLVGWPTHLLMLRIGFTDPFVYCCFGGSLAVAVFRVIVAPAFDFEISYRNSMLEPVLVAAIAGMIGGGVFWLLRRPDRDAPVATAPPRS